MRLIVRLTGLALAVSVGILATEPAARTPTVATIAPAPPRRRTS